MVRRELNGNFFVLNRVDRPWAIQMKCSASRLSRQEMGCELRGG